MNMKDRILGLLNTSIKVASFGSLILGSLFLSIMWDNISKYCSSSWAWNLIFYCSNFNHSIYLFLKKQKKKKKQGSLPKRFEWMEINKVLQSNCTHQPILQFISVLQVLWIQHHEGSFIFYITILVLKTTFYAYHDPWILIIYLQPFNC